MKERVQRLKVIKKIIRENRISSQESLLRFLSHEGYIVTQATLSRDLKLLKVGKVSEGTNGYYYIIPGEDEHKESEKNYVHDFLRAYVSIDFSNNLGVIHTLSGHADSLAIALDNLDIEGIVGTIAGDDTVLIILREDLSQDDAMQKLKEKIPEIEV